MSDTDGGSKLGKPLPSTKFSGRWEVVIRTPWLHAGGGGTRNPVDNLVAF